MGLPVVAACKHRDVTFSYVGAYEFSRAERRAIEGCAEAAIVEARQALPALPLSLTITVEAGKDVIPETGETATAYPPSMVAWVVDPARPGGVVATVSAQLRGSLHHELHHLVRDAAVPRRSLMDHVLAEGLATAFERDAAASGGNMKVPPWGDYPPNANTWVTELEALPPNANVATWLYGKHADGRRWIGLRAGTYLADRAARALKRTPAELVVESTARLLEAARG